MGAGFPIAIGRTMTTAAKRGAFGEFQLPAIARLKELQICFVVAIVAKVVAIVGSVAHYDVGVFLGNDQVVLVIESQLRRLIAFVTGITIEIGKVGFRGNELAVGNPGSRIAGD